MIILYDFGFIRVTLYLPKFNTWTLVVSLQGHTQTLPAIRSKLIGFACGVTLYTGLIIPCKNIIVLTIRNFLFHIFIRWIDGGDGIRLPFRISIRKSDNPSIIDLLFAWLAKAFSDNSLIFCTSIWTDLYSLPSSSKVYLTITIIHGPHFFLIEPNKRSGTMAASVEQCHINDSKQKKDSATNN